MDTLSVALGAVEVICLTDATRNDDCDGERLIGKPLLLKLGSAYLELVGDADYEHTRQVTVALTEPEAWVLRSKLATGTVGIDKSVIGAKLLRKLYAVLLEFASGLDLVPVEGDRAMGEPERRRLRQLEEEEDARAGASSD